MMGLSGIASWFGVLFQKPMGLVMLMSMKMYNTQDVPMVVVFGRPGAGECVVRLSVRLCWVDCGLTMDPSCQSERVPFALARWADCVSWEYSKGDNTRCQLIT